MIVSSGIITALIVTFLSKKRLFTEAEQLVEWL
jgi:hypothetical protein